MVDESTYNELDRYFTGRMQGDERGAFEQRLSSDANLKTELDWIVNATAAMKNSGRTVMKQHIAAAIAGIPAKEVLKYKPAKNVPSFWKKWWWIVLMAVTVAVAVSAALVYANVQQGEGAPAPGKDGSSEHSVVNEQLLNDSCAEENAAPANSDSAKPANAVDSIKGEGAVYYEVDPQTGVTEQVMVRETDRAEKPQIARKADTSRPAWAVAFGGDSQATKDIKMTTSIIPRKDPPYTYVLDQQLTLNADYTTTAGFRFRGSGDTVYMTDNNAQTFLLLRGKGEQPLVPLRVGVNK